MLTLEEIRETLKVHSLSSVSRQTGINRTSLSRLRNGHEENPTHKTMQVLSDYLAPQHRTPQHKAAPQHKGTTND